MLRRSFEMFAQIVYNLTDAGLVKLCLHASSQGKRTGKTETYLLKTHLGRDLRSGLHRPNADGAEGQGFKETASSGGSEPVQNSHHRLRTAWAHARHSAMRPKKILNDGLQYIGLIDDSLHAWTRHGERHSS